MKVTDAAFRVLTEAGDPLHYEEIARRILDAGLWHTRGKTPAATVGAQIYVEIQKRGDAARFRRLGKGVFALNGDTAAPRFPRPRRRDAPAERVARPLSFVDAAERVLEQFGNRQPMHYSDITSKALDLGLIFTKGKTPEATMRAHIQKEVERQEKRGERPRFVRCGRGYIGLAVWRGRDLSSEIEQHNLEIRKKLLARLRVMSPGDFEAVVGALLVKIGFDPVEVTARSNDGGIDVRGTLIVGDVIRTRMAVQVKRWKDNVHTPVVQQVRGSLGAHEQGLIITTSDFSAGARSEASRSDATPVGLMNGEGLVKLLMEHEIGVCRSRLELFELASNDEEA